MVKKSKVKYQNLAILVVAILLALSVIINISLSYFTDQAGESSKVDIRFGVIEVDATGTGASESTTFNLSASEVAMMDEVYKIIVLKNVEGKTSENFYLRVKLYYKNNGVVDNSKVKVNIASTSQATTSNYYLNGVSNYNLSNWTKSGDYYYYNNVVDITNTQYIPLVVTFDDSFGSDYLNNGKIYAEIDIVQSANNGYQMWEDRPSGWPNA